MIKEKDKLTENEYVYADEMAFSRIRSHVMNEVEEEEDQEGGQPRVPGPPCAPHGFAP